MRSARYKTIPRNRKVPFGIARQRELLDLVERRFAQAELLRYAVSRARGGCDIAALAENETISSKTAAGESASTASAPSAEGKTAPSTAEHTADVAAPADAASIVFAEAADAPASTDTPIRSVTVIWHGEEETVEHPEAWLAIFRDVSEAGDAITRELMRRRFRDEPYWKTCDALYISHSAYYQNVREILHYTLACATAHGILDPRPPKPPAEKTR